MLNLVVNNGKVPKRDPYAIAVAKSKMTKELNKTKKKYEDKINSLIEEKIELERKVISLQTDIIRSRYFNGFRSDWPELTEKYNIEVEKFFLQEAHKDHLWMNAPLSFFYTFLKALNEYKLSIYAHQLCIALYFETIGMKKRHISFLSDLNGYKNIVTFGIDTSNNLEEYNKCLNLAINEICYVHRLVYHKKTKLCDTDEIETIFFALNIDAFKK